MIEGRFRDGQQTIRQLLLPREEHAVGRDRATHSGDGVLRPRVTERQYAVPERAGHDRQDFRGDLIPGGEARPDVDGERGERGKLARPADARDVIYLASIAGGTCGGATDRVELDEGVAEVQGIPLAEPPVDHEARRMRLQGDGPDLSGAVERVESRHGRG